MTTATDIENTRTSRGRTKPAGGAMRPIDIYGAALLMVTATVTVAATTAFAAEHEEAASWDTLNAAGMTAYRTRDFVEAKAMFLRAMDTLEDANAPAPRTAATLNNLAATHESLGEYRRAALRYRHALTMIEALQGPEHPDVVAGLNNLASLLFAQRDFAGAEPLWQRGLSISERVFGEQHPHLIRPLVTLGLVTQAQRKFDRADMYYARAIRIGETSLGDTHPRLIPLYERYAAMLRQAHRDADAQAVERMAETIRTQNAPTVPRAHDGTP